MLLQGFWLLLGVIAVSNSRSEPSSTVESSALSYNDSSTIQSFNGSSSEVPKSFNASTTFMPSSHHQNSSKAGETLLSDSTDYPYARNEGENVRIFGRGIFPLKLTYGRLNFNLCGAVNCNDKILACFDSATQTSSMPLDPRTLCTISSQCGFQMKVEKIGEEKYVNFMGNGVFFYQPNFFGDSRFCNSIIMLSPEIQILFGRYPVCTPTITDNEMMLHVESASEDCPLVVSGAQLKPKETSSDASPIDSTTETASSSSIGYMWILYAVIGIIVVVAIGGGAYYLWRRRQKNRKSQATKNVSSPASVFIKAPRRNKTIESKDVGRAETTKSVKNKVEKN